METPAPAGVRTRANRRACPPSPVRSVPRARLRRSRPSGNALRRIVLAPRPRFSLTLRPGGLPVCTRAAARGPRLGPRVRTGQRGIAKPSWACASLSCRRGDVRVVLRLKIIRTIGGERRASSPGGSRARGPAADLQRLLLPRAPPLSVPHTPHPMKPRQAAPRPRPGSGCAPGTATPPRAASASRSRSSPVSLWVRPGSAVPSPRSIRAQTTGLFAVPRSRVRHPPSPSGTARRQRRTKRWNDRQLTFRPRKRTGRTERRSGRAARVNRAESERLESELIFSCVLF